MFRRKREVSSGPASIPWWPAGSDPADAAPPLATDDPFGGWPAFTEDTSAGHVVGRAPAWAAADEFLAEQHAAEQHADEFLAGQHAEPAAERADDRAPASAVAAAPAVADWLPLLTHPVAGQRFQPDVDAPPARPAKARRRPARRPGPPTTVTTCPDPVAPPDGTGTDTDTDTDHTATHDTATTDPATTDLATHDTAAAPDAAEASALAGAFAADYLSWDQDNPARRGRVLALYLHAGAGDATRLGWSGKGRQRAEFVLPGAVRSDGAGRVLVDVRVRVTPYQQVGETADPAPDGGREVAGTPAVAPAPTARGWKSLDSRWVRMCLPVAREGGRLVVAGWDDADRPAAPADDPATAEDTGPARAAGAAGAR